MRPYLFELPGYPVPSYFLLYGLGLLVACVVFEALCRRRGVPGRTAALVGSMTCLSVPVGGRIYYVLQHWSEFADDPKSVFFLAKGGQVFYGGFILGGLLALALLRVFRDYRSAMLDASAVSIPFGLSFGRLGCFLNGCCWGKLWDGPLAVCFPRQLSATGILVGSPAFEAHHEAGLIPFSATQSLSVFPAQLFAVCASLGVFFIMLRLYLRRRLEGRLAPLYVMSYAAIRWLLETMRVNPGTAGLSAAQWTGIPVFLIGFFWFLSSRSACPAAAEAASGRTRSGGGRTNLRRPR